MDCHKPFCQMSSFYQNMYIIKSHKAQTTSMMLWLSGFYKVVLIVCSLLMKKSTHSKNSDISKISSCIVNVVTMVARWAVAVLTRRQQLHTFMLLLPPRLLPQQHGCSRVSNGNSGGKSSFSIVRTHLAACSDDFMRLKHILSCTKVNTPLTEDTLLN